MRVPFADVNCLKVPAELRDEQAILLSDVLSTAWHANELGDVKEGDAVAIWCEVPALFARRTSPERRLAQMRAHPACCLLPMLLAPSTIYLLHSDDAW